ncbi:MAG: fasciclin domain-containing protein [Bacteroidota bacterium]
MKIQSFLIALFSLAISFQAVAQCGSHNKNAKKASWSQENDIIDIASGSETFGTLTAAVKTAGLVNTLQGDGPFTVFAPTNAAFAKLPEGTVKSLLEPKNKQQLTKILTYHVIAGEFKATDVVNAINSSGGSFTVETVSGDKLTASLQNNTVILTDENGGTAAVTQTDVDASNGVIHVIDSVVLPN